MAGHEFFEAQKLRKHVEKLAKEAATEEEEREKREIAERRRRLAYLEAMTQGSDLNDKIFAKSLIAQIPEDTYKVLSKPVITDLLQRRGHLPEDLALVFTRMHIEGWSEREYPIKESAIEMGNTRLEECGLLQKK